MLIRKIVENIYSKMASKKILILVILVMFAFIYAFNRIYPLMIDDWMYTFIFGQTPQTRVSSFFDIFVSQYNHYMQWGGRTVVHIIAQVLIWMDPFWHDLLNSIVFIGLLLLIYRISNYNLKTNITVFIVISVLFWFLQPGFAATMFWITGSANYLWGTLIILLFMYPYYVYYLKGESHDNVFKMIGFLVFGIIAGWTNENMSVALIFFIITLFIILRRQRKVIPLWAVFGLIGAIIGCAFMLLAPGNYIRYESEMVDRNLQGESLFSFDVLIPRITFMLWLYLKRVFILCLPCLILMYFYKKQSWNSVKKRIFIIAVLFLLSAHVAFISMLASPGFPNRALFGIVILIIISIGLIYANMNFKTIKSHIVILSVILLSIIGSAIDYGIKYKTVKLIDKTLKERERVIIEGKAKGQTDFVFTNGLKIRSRYSFTECTDDPDFWVNRVYQDYYGINSVRVIKEDKK